MFASPGQVLTGLEPSLLKSLSKSQEPCWRKIDWGSHVSGSIKLLENLNSSPGKTKICLENASEPTDRCQDIWISEKLLKNNPNCISYWIHAPWKHNFAPGTIKMKSLFSSLESRPVLWLALANKIWRKWYCASSELESQQALHASPLFLGTCHHHVNKPGLPCWRREFSYPSQDCPGPAYNQLFHIHEREPDQDQKNCFSAPSDPRHRTSPQETDLQTIFVFLSHSDLG